MFYGDTRPIHAEAVSRARDRDLRIHVFEEGYMRTYWVTYERGGSNGNSRLMELSADRMRADLAQSDMDSALPPRDGATCASMSSTACSTISACWP